MTNEPLAANGYGRHIAFMLDTCRKGHPRTPENCQTTPGGARVCRVCNREAVARYRRKSPRFGTPKGQKPQTLASQLAKWQRSPDECWPWGVGVDTRPGKDYARAVFSGRRQLAHRAVYEMLVGPIPSGMQIDHLCRNKPCVNPAHLEVVTARENLMRAPTVQARNAAKMRCVNGHPFDETNTIHASDGRRCRACATERMRGYRAAKRTA